MALTFIAPVVGGKVQVRFPEMCICCSRPAETVSTLKMSRETTVKKKRSEKKVLEYITVDVPHCTRCQVQNSRNDTMSWVSFFVGAIPAAVAAFFIYSLAIDWLFTYVGVMGSSQLEMDTGTVVILLALISGVPGGLLFELIIRVFFIPFFGRSLFYAPPLAMQLLGSQDYIAGLTTRLSKDAQSVELKVHNPSVAAACRQMPQPPQPDQTISTT